MAVNSSTLPVQSGLNAATIGQCAKRLAMVGAVAAAGSALAACGMGSAPSFTNTVVFEPEPQPVVAPKQEDKLVAQAEQFARDIDLALARAPRVPKPETTEAPVASHVETHVSVAPAKAIETPKESKPVTPPTPTVVTASAAAITPAPATPVQAAPAPVAVAPATPTVQELTPPPAITQSVVTNQALTAMMAQTVAASKVGVASPMPTSEPIITPVTTPSTLSAMGSMIALAPSEPAAAPTATAVAQAVEPTLENLIGVLKKKVEANPAQLQLATALALLESADSGKSAEAALPTSIQGNDQKIIQELVAAVTSINASASNTPTLAERTAPLQRAAANLSHDADLKLPKLALASRVDSFGVYTPVEPRFENGRKHTVIIYCEVANFASKKLDDSWFQTRLTQQDTLITEDGLLVWRPNPEDVEDRSMNQRKDFYLVKKLTLPDTLAIGKYTLRMSVTDKHANKVAMVSIPIEIVAR